MDQETDRKINQPIESSAPQNDEVLGKGVFVQNPAGQQGPNGEGFLSLAEASRQTGYHQDYLGFLCRTGKLSGFKIGRNWVTTKAALSNFANSYKNGVSEVEDETGHKIPVHVEKPKAGLPAKPVLENVYDSNLTESVFVPTRHTEQSPSQILSLTKLRKEVFDDIENRISKLSTSLSEVEEKVSVPAKGRDSSLELNNFDEARQPLSKNSLPTLIWKET